jgi:Tfp pilus assembly protein PilF
MDFFAKFGEKKSAQVQMADARYLIGLGHLGKGEQEKAREQFEKAVELDLDHVWAQTQLDDLKK